ncbi:acyl-CoA synthetase [Radiobacillus sp. PE A8.2]|uniref:acyl-CoA synthetase n=1 Tax=Radiobacillus sp. PE A8.2 TaxID=3380349 RepID=UPI00388D8A99
MVSYDVDWLKSRSILFPEKRAVIDAVTDESWTFKEIDHRADVLAHVFLANGIQKGDRVALLSKNHISYFDFLFACVKIGAVFVPLNWRLTSSELDYIIGDAAPKIIGIQSNFNSELNRLKNRNHVIEIDSNSYITNLPIAYDDLKPDQTISESDPLAIIYTGGTTGDPKGAVLTHRSILWNSMNTIVSWNLTNEDTTLTCLPMFHTGGLNSLTLPVIMAGGTVILSPGFQPEQAVVDLIRFDCTIVLFVPTMYHLLIKTEEFKQANFPQMKVFLSGGAPCPLRIYEAFQGKGLAFKEGYGLTEAGPNNFYIDPEDAVKHRGSVGKPMILNDIKIQAEHGSEAAANEVGELLVRGNHVFEFYWNKQEATKAAIINGWLHTGDLAKKDSDGYVYIVGRKKDMILSGGENVYPLEIENWLESHEAIDEIAVIGVSDDKWGEKVIAFVTTHQPEIVTDQALTNYCKQKLAAYKIPKQFHIVDELPKTHVGKINKSMLKSQIENTKSELS